MKDASEVRDQLVKMLGDISTTQGYTNNFISSRVYPRFFASVVNNTDDTIYPKTFVIIDKGNSQQGIGGEFEKTLSFNIVHIVKKVIPTDDAQLLVELALKDFERFFELNYTLGGYVENAVLAEFVTDGGVLDPEGVLSLRVNTERRKYGNE